MHLTVNGVPHDVDPDPRTTLLDLLRETLGVTGPKKGCDHGQCGACTVIVDGRRQLSCLALALVHDGDAVTTVEGLGTPEAPSPLQQAFVRHDAFQCGFCTPGQVCSATALLDELAQGWPSAASPDVAAPPPLTREEVAERMSGNLCRCAAYPNIVDAILEIARRAP